MVTQQIGIDVNSPVKIHSHIGAIKSESKTRRSETNDKNVNINHSVCVGSLHTVGFLIRK